ncbi:conserved hypothetical protein, partial [Trichinella spiralis]
FELPGLPEVQCCLSQGFTTHESELLEARHCKAASAIILVLKQQYLTSRSLHLKSLSPKVTVKRLTVDLEEPNGRDAVD